MEYGLIITIKINTKKNYHHDEDERLKKKSSEAILWNTV